MAVRFRYKIFLTFLAYSVAIIMSVLLIGRYFAHRNFEEYVSKVEMERVEELADALGGIYQKTQDWNRVVASWSDWVRVMAMPAGPPGKPPVGGMPPQLPSPPPMPPMPMGGPPSEAEGPKLGGVHPPPPPGPPPGSFAGRVSLFDVQKRSLTDKEQPSIEEYRLQAVVVDGRTVGWLGLRKRDRLTHPLDLEFIRQQSQTFTSVGALAMLLTIVITFVLSRQVLAPIKRLAEGARALKLRRFQTRIEIRSRDELGELAADFNEMAQALERYEQMRRQWLADISHELRTPLAILRGEIEAMQDGIRDVTPDALDSLHFEVNHLSRIVQELHELSLLESETFNAKRVAVRPLEILKDILGSFRTLCDQRGLRIEADANPKVGKVTILADAGHLKQLFSNILQNALRYANEPGVLKVSHELLQDTVVLHFEDSGPGVPEESLHRLFDRLYRVDKARSRSEGGSGLGLSICRSIVEGYGGWIEAANAPGAGLRISMGFPLHKG